MKNKLCAVLLFSLIVSNSALGQEDDYVSYDSIVRQLSTTSSEAPSYLDTGDPLSNVWLHAGVGMAMAMTTIRGENGNKTGLFEGVEINFGIDLFSPVWMAEGSYRNLGSTEIETKTTVDRAHLSEFDLKAVYRPVISRNLTLRSGFGLAARYLKYSNDIGTVNYTTPAWIALLGAEIPLSRSFRFTAELAYRQTLIEDTIDDSALSAGLRLDSRF